MVGILRQMGMRAPPFAMATELDYLRTLKVHIADALIRILFSVFGDLFFCLRPWLTVRQLYRMDKSNDLATQ